MIALQVTAEWRTTDRQPSAHHRPNATRRANPRTHQAPPTKRNQPDRTQALIQVPGVPPTKRNPPARTKPPTQVPGTNTSRSRPVTQKARLASSFRFTLILAACAVGGGVSRVAEGHREAPLTRCRRPSPHSGDQGKART